MIFCNNCGEAIPDGTKICPKCGTPIENSQAVVLGESPSQQTNNSVKAPADKNTYILWSIIGIFAIIFMNLNYLEVGIAGSLYYSSEGFTGFYLIRCLEGTGQLSGYMSILFLCAAVSAIIVPILYINRKIDVSVAKRIMLIQAIAYIIAMVVTYFHIQSLSSEFVSSISSGKLGLGLYLNLILSVIALIYYFMKINAPSTPQVTVQASVTIDTDSKKNKKGKPFIIPAIIAALSLVFLALNQYTFVLDVGFTGYEMVSNFVESPGFDIYSMMPISIIGILIVAILEIITFAFLNSKPYITKCTIVLLIVHAICLVTELVFTFIEISSDDNEKLGIGLILNIVVFILLTITSILALKAKKAGG